MLRYQVMLCNQLWRMKETAKNGVREFLTNEDGDTNFISIILVLVVVVAIAVIFRKNITNIVNGLWANISSTLSGGTPTNATFDIDSTTSTTGF